MSTNASGPFHPAYLTVGSKGLLGGEHPLLGPTSRHGARMEALLNRGVTTFVDLTQPHWENLDIYARDLRHANGALRPVRLHYPIRDASAPSRELLCEILDAIDVALLNGETVYVHCRSGVGRTGTVLGAHLVRHGMRGDDALHRLARVANGPAFGGVS